MQFKRPTYADLRVGREEVLVAMFSNKPFSCPEHLSNLRWILVRNVATASSRPEVIASKLEQLEAEILSVLERMKLKIYDCEPVSRGDVFDLLVLTKPVSRSRPLK